MCELTTGKRKRMEVPKLVVRSVAPWNTFQHFVLDKLGYVIAAWQQLRDDPEVHFLVRVCVCACVCKEARKPLCRHCVCVLAFLAVALGCNWEKDGPDPSLLLRETERSRVVCVCPLLALALEKHGETEAVTDRDGTLASSIADPSGPA